MGLHVLMIIAVFTKGLDACNIRICLTWTVHSNYIDLRCRVNYLIYAVEFYNNRRIEQGFCISPKPIPKCFPSNNNTLMMQNPKTNTTYLRISGQIDSQVNGQWECKHGTNTDSAVINVTVLYYGSRKNKMITDDKRCWKSYLAYTMIGFFCTIFLRLCLYLICRFKSKETAWKPFNQGCKEKLNFNRCKKAKTILSIVAVFLIILLFLVPVINGVVDRSICEGETLYIIVGVIIACLFLCTQEDQRTQPSNIDREGLLICTIDLKLIWNFVLNGQETANAPQTWSGKRRRSDDIRRKYMYRTSAHTIMDGSDTPHDSDEMPSYSCPSPNSPFINGQMHTEMELSGQESKNMGTSTKQIQPPDFHNRANELTTDMSKTRCFRVRNVRPASEYPVRRTFSGVSNDVWNEFIQYFENTSELNVWNNENSRRVLLSTLRGQAETYAYGIPVIIQRDYNRLKRKMEERFGHTAMIERYVTEAKLRKRKPEESLRDFGQPIEDLFRRAYPSNSEIVEENSIKAFLDKFGQSQDFRLAVKRTRPNTLEGKPAQRPIYEVEDGDSDADVTAETEGTKRENVDRSKVPYNYQRNNGIGSQGRFYNRDRWRGRDRSPMFKYRLPEFPEPRRGP
ncbi:unnamed protein product [Mytilus coruscus]|uniref:Uncharacterized protein n=1 Tax=Mytilus coruscus TaxID=42192 RepID=A0A6J8DCW7_MYTCO|nr:unnamed protein product [Mytilus coruscus]